MRHDAREADLADRSGAGLDVRRVDAGGGDPDAYLTRRRLRCLDVADRQHINSGAVVAGTIGSPGNDPYVITVGAMKTRYTATRADDAIASYSSKGPTLLDHVVKPDLVAPGNRMISLLAPNSSLPETYPGNAIPLSQLMVEYHVPTSERRMAA